MNAVQVRETLLQCLVEVAPEVRPSSIADGALLREQVDLDSMDWMNFVVACSRRLAVTVPPADLATLETLQSMVDYFAARAR